MTTDTFKGARYVTKFAEPIEWDSANAYEAITAVQSDGYTYISKQPVPAGVQISNEDFWLLWADPNAQVEALNQRITALTSQISNLTNRMMNAETNIGTLGNRMTSAEGRISTTEQQITALDQRVSALEGN